MARLEGLANGHPYQPEKISQGALRIIKTLSECLLEITGMDAITLQPAAGAHGELTGSADGPRLSSSRRAIRARRF